MTDACFLCGERDWKDMGVYSEVGRLVRCSGCGMVTLDSLGSVGEENVRHYTEGRSDAFPTDLEAQFRRWADFRLSQLLELQPQAHRIAEVGCGTGHFLAAAADRGLSAKGFDLVDCRTSARSAEFESAKNPFLELGKGQWDAIAAFHVLEHCPQPVEAMSFMLKAVKPGGTVFVEVPGIVDGTPPPAVLINRHHQWYFTEATMRALVEKCGGEVRQVSRVGPSIHELKALSAAGERMGRRWKKIKDVMPGFFMRAARGILRPHKERLTRALVQQERGTADPGERLALNLCVFSRPAAGGRS